MRDEREKIEYNHQIEYLKATFETKSKAKSILIDKNLV
jgi:hypothetical protein